MKFKETIDFENKIKPYEKGSALMWTDEYISKQLLKAHLDSENDAASRSGEKIEKTADWIKTKFGGGRKKLFDIGCGPGLYAEALAERSFEVVGFDFSQNSIDYAVNSAKEKGLGIEYQRMDYLTLDYEEAADIIIMIYCDFCVLETKEQLILLDRVYRALRPGGVFILDVYNELFPQQQQLGKLWEFSGGGFWREQPYLDLSFKKHYNAEKLILSQNIIVDENGFESYRFWSRYFCETEVHELMKERGFRKSENCGNILRSCDKTMEDAITFYAVTK